MCIGNGVKVKKESESTSYVVHALGYALFTQCQLPFLPFSLIILFGFTW